MIELKFDDENRILTIVMQGMISEADLDATMDALHARYPQVGVHVKGGDRGGYCALVDWETLEGWEKGAKTVGTMMSKLIGDAVRKLAVIADNQWSDEQPRLADIAKHAKVRFFAPGQRAEARAWLEAL